MKLRNKKTGEIKNINHGHILMHFNDGETKCINSLAELTEEWEDYEEPTGIQNMCLVGGDEISIEFYDYKEAKQAFERLVAWKRLKDNGFKFKGIMENWVGRGESPLNYMRTDRTIHFNKQEDKDWLDENWNDLLLLFGGENDNN